MGAESPIYHPALMSFRTFPKNMPNYASEGELLEAMSIEEDLIAHPNKEQQRYKCYRCYGTNRDIRVINGEDTACPECDGT